jgi:hypothetical protein
MALAIKMDNLRKSIAVELLHYLSYTIPIGSA